MFDNVAEARKAGEAFYFTGKPCSAGHFAKRKVSNRTCVDCQALRSKAWVKSNPEKVRKSEREHRTRHLDQERAKERAYRARNVDRCRQRRRDWGEAFPEKARESLRRWKEANPDSAAAIRRTRKARKRNAEGSHTGHDILLLFEAQSGLCAYASYCGRKLGQGTERHVDHIQPLARGGSNAPSNLQLLCRRCNQQKGALPPETFEASIGISRNPVTGRCT